MNNKERLNRIEKLKQEWLLVEHQAKAITNKYVNEPHEWYLR